MTTLDYDNLKRMRIHIESQITDLNELDVDLHDDDQINKFNELLSDLQGQLKILNIITGNTEPVKTITFVMSGYGDDNICMTGDIRDEVGAFKPKNFVMSDGTKGDAEYANEGVWRINVTPSDATIVTTIKGVSEDIDPKSDYTDKVTVTGPIEWIVFEGGEIVKPNDR